MADFDKNQIRGKSNPIGQPDNKRAKRTNRKGKTVSSDNLEARRQIHERRTDENSLWPDVD